MTIDENTIEHLAKLSRVKIGERQKEKLASDLEGIIGHFKELTELNTDEVSPVTGGTDLMNIFKEDEEDEELLSKGRSAFPEEERGLLKVPAVFEKNDEE
ncbi:MAG: Asp-tRNA(Asn)/Glu-tRNA(Gln) amidotransferase subunit GatC [Patescibacteria group bacterium]|nr:Asp-tRNA(Asn)/Glu-tRNA(Gln) amidotransferase subunit GatC [Patescibacteria group bacterium]MCL5262046.1 Asp-tRNA(Asn)/Glu-tRNA(Gln) amidotransferase subunit GatC [Patescibacteria group bacterium]